MFWRFLVVPTFVWVPFAPICFTSDLFLGLRTASSPQQNEEGICFFQTSRISEFQFSDLSAFRQVSSNKLHSSRVSWAYFLGFLNLPGDTSWASNGHFLGFLEALPGFPGSSWVCFLVAWAYFKSFVGLPLVSSWACWGYPIWRASQNFSAPAPLQRCRTSFFFATTPSAAVNESSFWKNNGCHQLSGCVCVGHATQWWRN